MKTLMKLSLLCFASIALTAAAAPALSDRDAKALVEKSWNALSWSLPMGKFDVAKDGSQRGKYHSGDCLQELSGL